MGPLKMCFPFLPAERKGSTLQFMEEKKKKNPEKEHVVFIVKEETG